MSTAKNTAPVEGQQNAALGDSTDSANIFEGKADESQAGPHMNSEFAEIMRRLNNPTPEEAAEQAKRDAERKAQDEKWERDQRIYQLERAGVLKRMRRFLDGPIDQTQAIREVDRFEGGILILSGRAGCGKTAAAVHWLSRKERGIKLIRATDFESTSRYDKQTMGELKRVAALVIDDLGTEYLDNKGNFGSMIDSLLDYRYSDELDTVITTNLSAADFKLRYGERIASRIRSWGDFVSLSSESLRRSNAGNLGGSK